MPANANNFEIDELTDAQEKLVDNFFAKGFFAEPDAPNHSGSNFEFVWENFIAAVAFHKANPDWHAYTVVTTDNERFHIIKGKHIVNRYGYLFSKTDAGLGPNDELRIR